MLLEKCTKGEKSEKGLMIPVFGPSSLTIVPKAPCKIEKF